MSESYNPVLVFRSNQNERNKWFVYAWGLDENDKSCLVERGYLIVSGSGSVKMVIDNKHELKLQTQHVLSSFYQFCIQQVIDAYKQVDKLKEVT